jgi:hypothetical protein
MASSSSDSESVDSDDELRRQFASGQLKPGLNVPSVSAKTFTNSIAALSDKLAGLTAAASTDWLERLDVTADCPLEQSPQEGTKESKIQDDFKREMAL